MLWNRYNVISPIYPFNIAGFNIERLIDQLLRLLKRVIIDHIAAAFSYPRGLPS